MHRHRHPSRFESDCAARRPASARFAGYLIGLVESELSPRPRGALLLGALAMVGCLSTEPAPVLVDDVTPRTLRAGAVGAIYVSGTGFFARHAIDARAGTVTLGDGEFTLFLDGKPHTAERRSATTLAVHLGRLPDADAGDAAMTGWLVTPTGARVDLPRPLVVSSQGPPTVREIEPNFALPAGGAPVTVRGDGLGGPDIHVYLGDAELMHPQVVDGSTLRGEAPPGPAGGRVDGRALDAATGDFAVAIDAFHY